MEASSPPEDEAVSDDVSSPEVKAASISASLSAGGSLSALAAAELRLPSAGQDMDDPNFDPSSLRIEDVYTKLPASDSTRMRVPLALQPSPLRSKGRGSERAGMSTKSKITIGDAEARLSGLLAPHAPSHRQLWNADKGRQQPKYALNEEDDEKWAAWRERVQAKEAEASRRAAEQEMSHSVPSGDTPPTGSLAIKMTSGVGFSTIIHDGSTGFDREPKTSLPYNERLMVPSLRKATRRVQMDRPAIAVAPSLPTIKDDGDDEPESQESGIAAKTALIAMEAEAGRRPRESGGASSTLLPGSVSQRGFSLDRPTAQDAHLSAGADPQANSPSPMRAPPAAIVAGIQAPVDNVQRRSPRPPYVRPAPPTSSNLVLQPDPKEIPAPLKLFDVEPDYSFAAFEKAERGDAGDVVKTVEFMHRLQMLKVSARASLLCGSRLTFGLIAAQQANRLAPSSGDTARIHRGPHVPHGDPGASVPSRRRGHW